MKDLTIALVQQDSPVGHRRENLNATLAWTKQAKEQGAQFVLFPELNITGHAGKFARSASLHNRSLFDDSTPCAVDEISAVTHELNLFFRDQIPSAGI